MGKFNSVVAFTLAVVLTGCNGLQGRTGRAGKALKSAPAGHFSMGDPGQFPPLPTDVKPEEIKILEHISTRVEGSVYRVEIRTQIFAIKIEEGAAGSNSLRAIQSFVDKMPSPEFGGLPNGGSIVSVNSYNGVRPAMLMNYIDGFDLNPSSFIYTDNRLSPAQIEQLSGLIEKVKTSGYVFSDANPGNFMATRDGSRVFTIDQYIVPTPQNAEVAMGIEYRQSGNLRYLESLMTKDAKYWVAHADELAALPAHARSVIAIARLAETVAHKFTFLESLGKPSAVETIWIAAKGFAGNPSTLRQVLTSAGFWVNAAEIGRMAALTFVGGYIGEKLATDGLQFMLEQDARDAQAFAARFNPICQSNVGCATAQYTNNPSLQLAYAISYYTTGVIPPHPQMTTVNVTPGLGAQQNGQGYFSTAQALDLGNGNTAYLYSNGSVAIENNSTGTITGNNNNFDMNYTILPGTDENGYHTVVWSNGATGLVSVEDGYFYNLGLTDSTQTTAQAGPGTLTQDQANEAIKIIQENTIITQEEKDQQIAAINALVKTSVPSLPPVTPLDPENLPGTPVPAPVPPAPPALPELPPIPSLPPVTPLDPENLPGTPVPAPVPPAPPAEPELPPIPSLPPVTPLDPENLPGTPVPAPVPPAPPAEPELPPIPSLPPVTPLDPENLPGVPVPAPAPPAPVPAAPTCLSVKPGPDWACVNGGWLPPGHPGIPSDPQVPSLPPVTPVSPEYFPEPEIPAPTAPEPYIPYVPMAPVDPILPGDPVPIPATPEAPLPEIPYIPVVPLTDLPGEQVDVSVPAPAPEPDSNPFLDEVQEQWIQDDLQRMRDILYGANFPWSGSGGGGGGSGDIEGNKFINEDSIRDLMAAYEEYLRMVNASSAPPDFE